MDVFSNLLLGFAVVFEWNNFLYCFIGVLVGTLIGVLPGIGPVAAMSLLLPATLKASPVSAIIMLAGIYYGAQYGGSITSILVNIPGEASTVITCIDGYQMARKGRAGPALGIAAIGSFIAGTLSVIGLMLLAPPLSLMALMFGPPEYFGFLCLGLTILVYLASGSVVRAFMMAAFGMIIGCIGQDPELGISRYTFGRPELLDGIGLAPFVMGLFGISEVFSNIEKTFYHRGTINTEIKGLLPNWQDWRDCIMPILRGSGLGFFLGILPGPSTIIATFTSYAIEKRISKHPEKFGKGAIEGVAGPESANNSATGGAFLPLLTLGIPTNAIMALLLGALMMHGVVIGPLMMSKNPEIFWGIIVSMYLGNIMLLILNIPLIGIWVQILRIPYKYLFPLILLFCLIGAYSISYSTFDVQLMLIFGVLGYLLKKYKFEAAPLVLAVVLGPMFENTLRQSLLISGGKFSVFFTRPIAAGAMTLTLMMIISCLIPSLRKARKIIPKVEEDL